jgi:hypothetical protein
LNLKRLQVEGSDRRWRGAIAGGGKRSQVEGSDRRWRKASGRGAIAGGGKLPLMEASDRRQVQGSDSRWRGAVPSEGSGSVQAALCSEQARDHHGIEQSRNRLQINT